MLRKNRFSWVYLGLAPLIFITASCSDSPTEQNTEGTPSRIFLQQVSFDSAMVKWRGEPDELWYGTDPKEYLKGLRRYLKNINNYINKKQKKDNRYKPY